MGRRSLSAIWLAAALVLACVVLVPGVASAEPANDNFDDAQELSGDQTGVAPGTTVDATGEPGEQHGDIPATHSVWYRWTAPRSGLIYLDFCSTNLEAVLAVYTGSSLAGLTEVALDRRKAECSAFDLSFRAVGGVEYRIAVDAAVEGAFSFTLRNGSEVPPNDDFANRAAMKDLGGNAFALGTTEGAGREVGEPAHGGSATGASVWYTWTAQRSGPTSVYPCHGAFHPVIDVYAGNALGSLSLLSAPGPGAALERSCSLGAAPGAVFTATAGQTYAIAVDGANGDWGHFEMRLREAPLPRVPRPPQTLIRKEIKIRGRTAKILFTAQGGAEARYLCKLDRRPFRRCSSPKTYRGLSAGRHRFAVVAIAVDEFGDRDPTPAVRRFRITNPKAGR